MVAEQMLAIKEEAELSRWVSIQLNEEVERVKASDPSGELRPLPLTVSIGGSSITRFQYLICSTLCISW
jgi:hypothetical protein